MTVSLVFGLSIGVVTYLHLEHMLRECSNLFQ